MREIKFRAWDKYAKRIDYHIEMLVIRELNTFSHPIMQYTGLKDKNGVEIYEGDICNVDGPIAEVKYFTDLNWDSGGSQHPGFWFNFDFMRDNELTYHDGFDDCEVIGNIYENPELLGEANT